MDIIKLAGGICGGVLVKDYTPYKNGATSDTTTKFYGLIGAIKLHDAKGQV